MWHLKSIILEKWALFWGFQHTFLMGFLKEIDGKTFIFRVNLGMGTLKSILLEKWITVLRVSTHIYGVSHGDRWKNIHFSSKPRHVTPQIYCLGKMIPVLRVSTHIYGVSKLKEGKMFIFWGSLGMWPLKLIVLEKWALFWGFQHTFMGFLRG